MNIFQITYPAFIIKTKNNNQNPVNQSNRIASYNYTINKLTQPEKDIFISNKNVSFTAAPIYDNHEFETTYNKLFFKKILKEGITDAYSDITLIPREDIDKLKNYGTLNKKSSVAVKALKKYKQQMFPIEKDIFSMLEKLSKKNPNLNLQELLQLKYPQAEQTLINQQCKILNKMNLLIRRLPKEEYLQMRKLLQSAFDKIFEPDPIPEKRFGRKLFISELYSMSISDKKLKKKLIAIAETLPQSSDSINAFIVKYCQPYKLRYNYEKEKYIKIPRTPEEIGLRLIEPSVGTDDHIHPQEEFRNEALARENGDKNAENLSKLRVTILTSKKMNELKRNNSIDEFIKTNPNVVNHIQNHINELMGISEKWTRAGKYQDALKLANYIILLKDEFENRSNIIKIDLGTYEETVLKLKEKIQLQEEKSIVKHKKRTGNANNNHGEKYIDKNGNSVENRKVQKHNSRFCK